MRKIVAVLLCIMMFTMLAACRDKQEDSPDDYSDVIELYQKVIGMCAWYEDSKAETYAEELGITDPAQKELFDELLYAAYLNYPGRGREDHAALAHKLSCGYAIKDLNGDEIQELVLLQEDYTVVAVLTMSNGTVVLLDTYQPRRRAWIDGDGLIHLCGSNGADKHVDAVYKIAKGGQDLELLIEYGTLGYEVVDGIDMQRYYKLQGELTTHIAKEEYDALETQWEYLEESGANVTKNHSGLTFTPLFEQLITKEKAIENAKAFWKRYEIDNNQYRVELGSNAKAPDSVYVVIIRRLVNGDHYSTFDEIWVEKTTGDVMTPTWDDIKG